MDEFSVQSSLILTHLSFHLLQDTVVRKSIAQISHESYIVMHLLYNHCFYLV